MIQLAFKRLWNRKLYSFAIFFSFIFLYILVPAVLELSSQAKLTVTQVIEDYGRGTYDILVRPSGTRTPVEQRFGMVEENYIGDSKGGISINEWEEIKKNPLIEVAAPVASVGYFSGKRLSVSLPQLTESTRFTWQFVTSDGLKKYPLNVPTSLVYFKESTPGNIQYLKNMDKGDTASGGGMEIMFPSSHHLLVGIDPESESKITKIDFSGFNNEMEKKDLEIFRKNFGNVPIIKVLQRKDITIPIFLNLTTESLDIEINNYRKKLGINLDEWLMAANGQSIKLVLEELTNLKAKETKQFNINLSPFQRPFDGTAVFLNEKFEAEEATDYVSDRGFTSVYYTSSKQNYIINNNQIKVNILDHGPPPSYKEVQRQGASLYDSFDAPFIIEQVGFFAPELNISKDLASSPLGIYTTSETKDINGISLTPTTVPGSFIPQPAGGLTTLDAAEIIKGKKPIDAIRIKVAGITKYNTNAQNKIEQVATNLLKKGYEVDIVAGSSFKKVELDVEGIGTVIAPWTTLGVAQELSKKWDFLSLITVIFFTFFGFVWLIARLTFEKNAYLKENELLSLIGWQKSEIFWKNCLEQYIIQTSSLLIATIVLTTLKAEPRSFFISFILWVFSIIFITLLLSKKTSIRTRASEYPWLPAIVHYRRFIIPTMIVLALSLILIAIQVSNIGFIAEQSSLTALGEFTVNKTFWLSIGILVTTVILSAMSVGECLTTLLNSRASEFHLYKLLGWTKKQIFRHFSTEVFIWSGAALAGSIISSILILFFLKVSMKWIAFGSAGGLLIVSSLIFLLLIKSTKEVMTDV
ncbi:ABC transporter permease [Bacillus sp. B-jedd]|uniref:ABC transporter permease n=1 Tax=Bacillus sp. B-jedd TaxID=1476857 RepID=UPI00051557D4|nr:ABC transporter permease [Bacillus sp. B-jedd]CEG25470.1 hypothetical protein BN1002_00281 [Bacillus sp. B-jedd]